MKRSRLLKAGVGFGSLSINVEQAQTIGDQELSQSNGLITAPISSTNTTEAMKSEGQSSLLIEKS